MTPASRTTHRHEHSQARSPLLVLLACIALWAVSCSGSGDEDAIQIPLPPLTELTWEVDSDAEIVATTADSITVRYVALGANGEDADGNEYGSVHATLPTAVVAGIVAEGYEFQVTCTHEPTAVSVRVCRTGLFTDAGETPAWGSYSGTTAPERGPAVCRAVPNGSEIQLTVYAYPAAPSAYNDFRLSPATELTGCQ